MGILGINFILGISDKEQLAQFLHGSINNLVGRIDSAPKNISSDIDWSSQDYEKAQKFVQNVYRKKISNMNYDIQEDLRELGTEQIDCIKECYEIRKPEIRKVVIKEYMAKMDCPLATDVDWKLKWIIGSSTLSSLREPLLQMDIRTTNVDSDEDVINKTVQFEMNIAELKNFMNEIEKCLTK